MLKEVVSISRAQLAILRLRGGNLVNLGTTRSSALKHGSKSIQRSRRRPTETIQIVTTISKKSE